MLPVLKALEILETYEGPNNQLLYWKHRIFVDNASITKAQADYVLKYHATPVRVAKRPMKIEKYFGEKLQEEKRLIQAPESIWVEKLLAESDKAYHIMGRVGDRPMEFMWVPKCFVIRENKKKANIDYTKYAHRPPLAHQIEAIEKLVTNNKFILADDMGAGKTTSTTIAALECGATKVLIICPATLKINWKREIANYTNKSVFIVDGKEWVEGHDFYIINYDIIKNFHNVPGRKKTVTVEGEKVEVEFTEAELELMKRIEETHFDLLIIDEAHFIANPAAQRTKLINDIAEKSKRLWLLTGTPMTSRPINYYNLLKLVDAPVAYNWQTYVRRYCKGFQFRLKTGKRIWNVSGASNLDELRERTQPYLLRRLKTDILDLPEKIITPVYLELKSKRYEEEMGEYLDWTEREGSEQSLAVQIAQLMRLRMLIAEEKITYTCEVVQRLIEQEKKVIVFTNFTDTLDRIATQFGKAAVTLDGRMTKARRQLSVDQFQEDPKKMVFVSNLKAGGVGITLTAAEAVVMNDLSFVPVEHAQAEDRAFRYGQTKSVSVYYPLFENTIEMIIYDILCRKKTVIGTVMGDMEFSPDFGAEVMEKIKKG